MTDNEIIKALDKCVSIGESCEDCPFYDYTDCDKRLKEHFHDLINRQKAEIEKLTIALENKKTEMDSLYKNQKEKLKYFEKRLEEKRNGGEKQDMKHIDNLIQSLEEADKLLKGAKPYLKDPFCIEKAIEYIKSNERSGINATNKFNNN